MKQGWEIKKLGEVCELSAGGDVPKDNFSETKTEKYSIPIYANGEKNEGLYGYTNIAKVSKPSITVSARGTIGFSVKRLEAFLPVVRLIVVTPKNQKELELDFLDYSLKRIDFKHSGSSIPQLTVPMIRDYKIPLPPLPEQQRIVSILDQCFAAIDKAKANAEQNLKNAAALFESYLQGVFEKKSLNPDSNDFLDTLDSKNQQKSSNQANQKNQGSDNKQGWEEKKLGEVFEIKPPKKQAREKLSDNDLVSFLPMEDLGVCENEIKATREKQMKEVAGSYTYFAENDVLLAKITPCFENGKLGVAKNLKNGIGFGSSEYIVFRCPNDIVPEFLFYFLSRESLREEGKKYMSGAVGHKRLSKDWIENYFFSYPKSKEHQQTIVRQLDALRAETQKLEAVYQKKIADLEELKKSILQKAFLGQLTMDNGKLTMDNGK
jgi:type I restriction enzyme S subunit